MEKCTVIENLDRKKLSKGIKGDKETTEPVKEDKKLRSEPYFLIW